MFLRCQRRKKDGKTHEHWSVVENRRLSDGRLARRQVLYRGEINASQREAWRKTIEVCDEGQRRQVALMPAGSMPCDDVDAVGVCLSQLRLQRPRQWGGCWLALPLWQELELDSFRRPRLRPSREGTPWLKGLKTLVAYRLIEPGSEWRLHRPWFDTSAMADLMEDDFGLAEKNTLYRCLDELVQYKGARFKFLVRRWGELFGARFDVLLYDLTSTHFETDYRGPKDLRQFGCSRDKRGDCRQVVVALIVTPEGFPRSYEFMGGGTADNTSLSGFLDRIEHRCGKADRIWVMDRGIPTEDNRAKMRSIGASHLVGTPKGRLSKLEQAFLNKPWARVRDGVQVKRLNTDQDVYVLAQSDARIDKERGMRRKRLRQYPAGRLLGHTTLLNTDEGAGLLADYMALARLLQPALVVIEDADLVARERAAALTILNTTRPQALEPALASRPARIDQAIEFSLPDLEVRQRLIASYAQGVAIPDAVIDDLARRTDGASPAFIKEQLRRVARLHIEGQAKGPVDRALAETALHEILFSGGVLNTRWLGGNAQAS